MDSRNTGRDDNHTDRLSLVGTIAQKNPDELKITVGARGSSHQVTFEVFDAKIDQLVQYAGERLRISIERLGDGLHGNESREEISSTE